MNEYDPNVSPYLLRPPVSYEQAMRICAKREHMRSKELDPVDRESRIGCSQNQRAAYGDDGHGRRRD